MCVCSYCTPQGSHLSYRHSHPPHHTSRTVVCTECYYTGTHPGGSAVPLREKIAEEGEMWDKSLTPWTRHINKPILERNGHAHTHQKCHNSLHHCHQCSQHLHHSASGAGYSDRSYTGTDPPHTSDHSRSERHRQNKIIYVLCGHMDACSDHTNKFKYIIVLIGLYIF